MLLQGRNAVIYGAANGTGAAVAKAVARDGATVFLAGRNREPLEAVAREIAANGGSADVARVDPLSASSVERHASYVINEFGTLDVSINLAFLGSEKQERLTGLSDEEFVVTSFTRARSNFVTATAAARKMAYQGSGVILAAASPEETLVRGSSGGLAIGSAAIEVFCRQLALEVEPRGVRVAFLRSAPAPERAMLNRLRELPTPTTGLRQVAPAPPSESPLARSYEPRFRLGGALA